MTPQQFQQLLQQADTCAQSGDHAAARQAFHKALEYAPDNPDLLFAAGNSARHCGLFEEAADLFKRASQTRAGFFAALCNLGASLKELQRFTDAIPPLKEALQLRPDVIPLSLQLAELYLSTGHPDDARILLEAALQKAPDHGEILCGLGNCALARKNLSEAKSFYHRALHLQPDYGDAHYNLGTVMREWNHLDEAVLCFRNAVRFKPGVTAPLVDLGETLQLLGETDESETVLREALSLDPQCSIANDNLLVTMNYNPRHSRKDVETAHRKWGTGFLSKVPHLEWPNSRDTDRPLKIGYLSPDFCDHPAASFLEPVLRNHHHDNCEIYCYSQTIHSDWRTGTFRQHADHWYDVQNLDDDAATKLIRSHTIDILIDTAGHLRGNRLGVFARRAAPFQIGGIGYPGLRGLETIDCRISDSLIDPPENNDTTTEEPLRIDPSFCCWHPPENPPPVAPLPAEQNGFLTFGSLHTTARLNASVIELWSNVLRAVPNAHLLICRTTLVPSVITRLSGWFAENGIAPERITCLPTIPAEGHLSVYHQIDVTLDTHPWSGHTTACESLIMGVPVLTLFGDRPAGRMVSSVLSTVGLDNWIAATPEAYITQAVNTNATLETLQTLRAGLRNNVLDSPLCNETAYTTVLENRLRELWHRWCNAHR